MNSEELDDFKENYTLSELVDVSNMKFNVDLDADQMLNEYMIRTKNPYHFKSGDVEIEVQYSDTDKTVSDLLKDYFLRQK